MSEEKTSGRKKLTLASPGRLELRKTVDAGQVRQSFSHGRTKAVNVEVKRRRAFERSDAGDMRAVAAALQQAPVEDAPAEEAPPPGVPLTGLSERERQARLRALESEQERRREEEREAALRPPRGAAETDIASPGETGQADATGMTASLAGGADAAPAPLDALQPPPLPPSEADAARGKTKAKPAPQQGAATKPDKPEKERKTRQTMRLRGEPRRRRSKLTIYQALDDDQNEETRGRSMAALRRQRERERERLKERLSRNEKVLRDVVVPEIISVGDLANRMAERSADVVRAMMKMGVMATVNQMIDADTAELVVAEFGHRIKRVSEADIEDDLIIAPADPGTGVPRAPVVTVMGHVDHGKTSLLDALRQTDVAAGEAGGITQHIGAYRVTLASNRTITFLDTPGHEAFTAMRGRGARVTDIVVLVVAADDGLRPQSIEAINHAKAAGAPIIVAINKMDKHEADPLRVKTQLLEHELAPEDMGGDVQCVEISALEKRNLDKLEEAILLQAELLELTGNPDRQARGVVIEAKLEKGRGAVATLLVQSGTLGVGDIFVAGAHWGRVRALLDERGQALQSAGPSVPVEVLGLQGAPGAGDEFAVLESESRAREIAEYRARKQREQNLVVSSGRSTLEQMFSRIQAGEVQELPVVIKADVQGSLEALGAALDNLATEEVKVRILHGAVGGITESDVSLANSVGGVILGFNVRANPAARELAARDGVDIRYFAVIYEAIDDMKAVLGGMLAPEQRENFLGYAEVRDVFTISKVGRVAGCMVTEGEVRRGARVRLLRDDTVIFTGALKQLKRFKDDAREVRQGYECGMSLENYDDIRAGDRVECFSVEEVARQL